MFSPVGKVSGIVPLSGSSVVLAGSLAPYVAIVSLNQSLTLIEAVPCKAPVVAIAGYRNTVVFATLSGELVVVDCENDLTPKILQKISLSDEGYTVTKIAINGKQGIIAVGNDLGGICIYSLSKLERLQYIEPLKGLAGPSVSALLFWPINSKLLYASGRSIYMLQVENGLYIADSPLIQTSKAITSLAFDTSDPHAIIAGAESGDIFVFNIRINSSPTVSLKVHEGPINEIVCADGNAYTISADGSLICTSIPSQKSAILYRCLFGLDAFCQSNIIDAHSNMKSVILVAGELIHIV